MTTLIIHPQIGIQRKIAFQHAGQLLGIDMNHQNLHPDIHLIDGTLVTSIGIDEIRELLRKLQYQPYQANFQIGLIIQANMLTIEAQNSLLKSLEEPGLQTHFILTVPHEKFLIPTIISRSNKVYVAEKLYVENQEKEPKEQDTNIPEFLQLPLVDKFLEIEKILEKEKEQHGAVNSFLNGLIAEYRKQLLQLTIDKQTPEMQKATTDIKNINRATHQISRNVNKRLALENLMLQLEH